MDEQNQTGPPVPRRRTTLKRVAVTAGMVGALVGGGYGFASAATPTPSPSSSSGSTGSGSGGTAPTHNCPHMGGSSGSGSSGSGSSSSTPGAATSGYYFG